MATETTTKKKERVKLPSFKRQHETKAQLDAEVQKAREAGHKPKRTRKFEVGVNGSTYWIIEASKKALVGRVGLLGLLKDVKVTEHDAPVAEKLDTIDSIYAAIDNLPEAEAKKIDIAKVKAALAAHKAKK